MYSAKALLITAALAGTSFGLKTDSPECSAAVSIYSQDILPKYAPETPSALSSFIAEHTEFPAFTLGNADSHQSQLCSALPLLPSSLLPDLQTLAAELFDFAHTFHHELEALITACVEDESTSTRLSQLNHALTYTGNLCDETATPTATPTPSFTPTPGPGSYSNYPTPTPKPTSSTSVPGDSSSSTSSVTPIPTAAATKHTGASAFMGAAAVVMLGAAFVL